jgi:hypothetical protein
MTAVECLKQDIDLELKHGTKMVVNWDMYLQMEKQQILDCCITTTQDVWISAMGAFGQEINFCDEDLEEQKQEAEQYYKETFKQKEQ